VRVMARMVWIFPRISVAPDPEEWREVLAPLETAPELQRQIIEQLRDVLRPDYSQQLTDSIG